MTKRLYTESMSPAGFAQGSAPSFAKGFTLVELLLVLLILGSLALMTTFMVDNLNEQSRFDQTKSRLEQIRRAIIGDSSRTLNGQPEISGFVADMGRLPANLKELIEQPTGSNLWGEVSLSSVAELSGVRGLYGGWRGPYLDTLPESESGSRAFRDGWGNDISGVEENYGWVFTGLVSSPPRDILPYDKISVQSYGADGEAGPMPADNPYDKDFPPDGELLVSEFDWSVDLSGQPFKVQLNRSTTDSQPLKLKIYTQTDGVFFDDFVAGDLSSTHVGIASQELQGYFDPKSYLPMGTHLVIVVCAATFPAIEQPYDGDCNSTFDGRPQFIKIVPRSFTPPLQFEWNAP